MKNKSRKEKRREEGKRREGKKGREGKGKGRKPAVRSSKVHLQNSLKSKQKEDREQIMADFELRWTKQSSGKRFEGSL